MNKIKDQEFLLISKKFCEKEKQMKLIYIEVKLKMIDQIYDLLISSCKANYDNEIYTFDKIHEFQFHV